MWAESQRYVLRGRTLIHPTHYLPLHRRSRADGNLVQENQQKKLSLIYWIPTFAGMTETEELQRLQRTDLCNDEIIA